MHRLRACLERIKPVLDKSAFTELATAYPQLRIAVLGRIEAEVLLRVIHGGSTLRCHYGIGHVEAQLRVLTVYVSHVHDNLLLLVRGVFKDRNIACHNHYRETVGYFPVVYLAVRHDVVAVVHVKHFICRTLVQHIVVHDFRSGQRPAVNTHVRQVHHRILHASHLHLSRHLERIGRQEVDGSRTDTVHINIRHLGVAYRGVVYDKCDTVVLSGAETRRHGTSVAGDKRGFRSGYLQSCTAFSQVHHHRILIVHKLGGELHLKSEPCVFRIERQRGDVHVYGRSRINLQRIVHPSATGVPVEAFKDRPVRSVSPALLVRVTVGASHRT